MAAQFDQGAIAADLPAGHLCHTTASLWRLDCLCISCPGRGGYSANTVQHEVVHEGMHRQLCMEARLDIFTGSM